MQTVEMLVDALNRAEERFLVPITSSADRKSVV